MRSVYRITFRLHFLRSLVYKSVGSLLEAFSFHSWLHPENWWLETMPRVGIV